MIAMIERYDGPEGTSRAYTSYYLPLRLRIFVRTSSGNTHSHSSWLSIDYYSQNDGAGYRLIGE